MIIQQTPLPFYAQNIQQRYSDIDILTSKVINVNFSYGIVKDTQRFTATNMTKKFLSQSRFQKLALQIL